MSTLPSHVVASVPEFIKWLKAAMPNEICLYHTGDIGVDRKKLTLTYINDLADTAMLLSETGYVILSQSRYYLPTHDGWAYHAQRTGRGYAPKAIMDGKLTSFEWRALRALRDRDADISATRAVRDALSFAMSSSDQSAEALLQALKARRLVQEAPGKGWELSKLGVGALT